MIVSPMLSHVQQSNMDKCSNDIMHRMTSSDFVEAYSAIGDIGIIDTLTQCRVRLVMKPRQLSVGQIGCQFCPTEYEYDNLTDNCQLCMIF